MTLSVLATEPRPQMQHLLSPKGSQQPLSAFFKTLLQASETAFPHSGILLPIYIGSWCSVATNDTSVGFADRTRGTRVSSSCSASWGQAGHLTVLKTMLNTSVCTTESGPRSSLATVGKKMLTLKCLNLKLHSRNGSVKSQHHLLCPPLPSAMVLAKGFGHYWEIYSWNVQYVLNSH